jgi:hypothetical protein
MLLKISIFLIDTLSVGALFFKEVYIFILLRILNALIVRFFIKPEKYITLYTLFIPYSALLFFIKSRVNLNQEHENIDTNKLFMLENLKPIKRNFGESTIHSLVNNQKAPAELRLKAFIILAELITPSTVLLLKKGLSDENDEIRLLCYSVLNNIEKNIQNKIHDVKNSKLNGYEKNIHLAKLHWELIYLNLVDNEFKEIILKEIFSYINLALAHRQEKEILKFKAKIHMYQKEYDKAYQIYKNFTDDKEIIPYLIEIYFYKKEYEKIKEYISKYPHIRYYDKLYNIYRFWNG